eukprot:3084543-Rhodomonas_salina.1
MRTSWYPMTLRPCYNPNPLLRRVRYLLVPLQPYALAIPLRPCYAVSGTDMGLLVPCRPTCWDGCYAVTGVRSVSYTHLRAHETEADL